MVIVLIEMNISTLKNVKQTYVHELIHIVDNDCEAFYPNGMISEDASSFIRINEAQFLPKGYYIQEGKTITSLVRTVLNCALYCVQEVELAAISLEGISEDLGSARRRSHFGDRGCQRE